MQPAITERCSEGGKGVGHPAEGEGDGGEGKRAGACELGDAALDDVAADDHEDGEDVFGVLPLCVHCSYDW